MRRSTPVIAAVVSAAAITVSFSVLRSPTVSRAQGPPTLTPVSVTIAPGETVRLPRLAVIPLPPQPGVPTGYMQQDVPVTNQSDQSATATSDGRIIRVSAPAGFVIRAVQSLIRHRPDGTYEAVGMGGRCPAEDGTPHVAVCDVAGGVTTPIAIQFSAAPVMGLALAEGCTNITSALAFPPGPLPRPLFTADVARAVTPAGALIAVWKFDNARRRFLAWSPLPSAPNDFTTIDPLEPVWLCVRSPATLVQQP